jgi:hypothetical protein
VSSNEALVREILERVADKWTLLVIDALDSKREVRFSRLRERIGGVSQKMLSNTLRQLERDGLVKRRVHAEVPLQGDRLRPIEDREQWHAANGREMIDEGPRQRFRALVRHGVTSTHREYFNRLAKECARFSVPSRKPTSTCPKSCCENSPAKPSKRTSGRTLFGRRLRISSYSAVFPPV